VVLRVKYEEGVLTFFTKDKTIPTDELGEFEFSKCFEVETDLN